MSLLFCSLFLLRFRFVFVRRALALALALPACLLQLPLLLSWPCVAVAVLVCCCCCCLCYCPVCHCVRACAFLFDCCLCGLAEELLLYLAAFAVTAAAATPAKAAALSRVLYCVLHPFCLASLSLVFIAVCLHGISHFKIFISIFMPIDLPPRSHTHKHRRKYRLWQRLRRRHAVDLFVMMPYYVIIYLQQDTNINNAGIYSRSSQ